MSYHLENVLKIYSYHTNAILKPLFKGFNYLKIAISQSDVSFQGDKVVIFISFKYEYDRNHSFKPESTNSFFQLL